LKALQNYWYSLGKTFHLLAKPNLWIYLLPAILIGIIFYGIGSFFPEPSETAQNVASNNWFSKVFHTSLNWVLSIGQSIGDFLYKFILLTLFSPFNSLLSEKVDNSVTNAKFNGGVRLMIRNIFRTISILSVSTGLYLVAIFIWWIISKITGIHALDSIVYFFISAYFIGFSFFDYSLERYEKGISSTLQFGFKYKISVLLSGLIFSCIYLIPVIGIIFAPFFVTLNSTLVYLQLENKLSKHSS
jgi:CysZ protein